MPRYNEHRAAYARLAALLRKCERAGLSPEQTRGALSSALLRVFRSRPMPPLHLAALLNNANVPMPGSDAFWGWQDVAALLALAFKSERLDFYTRLTDDEAVKDLLRGGTVKRRVPRARSKRLRCQ
jgi:hypothetical protein